MKNLKASVLFIAIAVAAPMLVLHKLGISRELIVVLQREYAALGLHGALALWMSYLLPTMCALLSAWVVDGLSRQWQRFAFLFGLSVLLLTLSPVLAVQGWIVETFTAVLAVLLSGLLAMIFCVTERGSRVHAFRELFVGRLSTCAFDELIEGKEPVKLAGRRSVTTLTCRLLNSSELATRLEAQDFERLMSAFLKAIADFLIERGAYIDVCNSQGISAQLGFPVRHEAHALHACRLALSAGEFLDTLAKELEQRWNQRPVLGIGVASGECVCGLIGHGSFQFYSVLGEPPEMSRRLCNMNNIYGSRVLISASTFSLVKNDVEVRPMELLAAPGQTGLQEVYELLAEKGTMLGGALAARDTFWEGVVALRQGDAEKALAKFRQGIVVGKTDGPLNYFKQRAEAQTGKRESHVRQTTSVE